MSEYFCCEFVYWVHGVNRAWKITSLIISRWICLSESGSARFIVVMAVELENGYPICIWLSGNIVKWTAV